MSSASVAEVTRLEQFLEQLRRQAQTDHHRYTVVVSGEQTWAHKLAVAASNFKRPLWIGNRPPFDCRSLEPAAGQQILGEEFDCLIIDAFAGFDPDSCSAACGTLIGGGLLLLITPRLDQWSGYPDPQHSRMAVANYDQNSVTGLFLGRLAELISRDPHIVRITQGETLPELPEPPAKPTPSDNKSISPPYRSEDQARAVAAVVELVAADDPQPLVLTSDRGRGKSSALGLAAAQLLQSGVAHILVTAPRRSAVKALFEQAAKMLGQSGFRRSTLVIDERTIRFCAPDELVRGNIDADLLLVDEAAGVPLPLLMAMAAHHRRIVFATTVQGYEGSGHGFTLRFQHHLSQHYPNWHALELNAPLRWAADDPLESWLSKALLLDAEPVVPDLVADVAPMGCQLVKIEQQRLAQDESLLRQLFGLLRQAHYRTTPLDLRYLLDGPNVLVFGVMSAEQLVAAALLTVEGGFDSETAFEIWAGRRRPRGHLLAQSFAAHCGIVEAPQLTGARIMRIVVHPELQRRGIGSWLLDALCDACTERGFAHIGTSFGATVELLRFWIKCGYRPVRVGSRRGSASGAHSVLLLRPLNGAGEELAERLDERFSRDLAAQLGEPLVALEPELRRALDPVASGVGGDDLEASHWRELCGFGFGQRDYAVSLAALKWAAEKIAAAEFKADAKSAELIVEKVLMAKAWPEIANRFGFAGRAAITAELRNCMRQLISNSGPSELGDLITRLQSND